MPGEHLNDAIPIVGLTLPILLEHHCCQMGGIRDEEHATYLKLDQHSEARRKKKCGQVCSLHSLTLASSLQSRSAIFRLLLQKKS